MGKNKTKQKNPLDFAKRRTKLPGSSKWLQRNSLPTDLYAKCPRSFGAGSLESREGRAGITTVFA